MEITVSIKFQQYINDTFADETILGADPLELLSAVEEECDCPIIHITFRRKP